MDTKDKILIQNDSEISVTAMPDGGVLGYIAIDNGSKFEPVFVYIDDGTTWNLYYPYIDNGSSWDRIG